MKQKMSKILVKTKNPTKLIRMKKGESSARSKKAVIFCTFCSEENMPVLCALGFVRWMDGNRAEKEEKEKKNQL